MIETLTLDDADQTKLVKIRNPWNKETYHGPWSDESDLWTRDLLEQAGHTSGDDGEYWMSIKTLKNNYESITVAENV